MTSASSLLYKYQTLSLLTSFLEEGDDRRKERRVVDRAEVHLTRGARVEALVTHVKAAGLAVIRRNRSV